MKKPPSKGDLYALETMEALQLSTTGIVLVPAVYLRDARGMTTENPGRAWYSGCTQCKKQLDSQICPDHGENKGKKVYGGQIVFADPSHRKEFAVWEETLRRMIKEFLKHDDIDKEDVMEDLVRVMRTREVCIRVGVGHRKSGVMSFDLFDITPQVTDEGCLAVYRATSHSLFDSSPGVVPACCQNVKVNNFGQLIISQKSSTQTVESAKMLFCLIDDPQLDVLDNIDGIKVTLPCKCLVCESPCTLFAAGVPQSVQHFTRMCSDMHFFAFVQSVESDGCIPIGYHVELKDPKTLHFELRVFKYQAAQFLLTLAAPTGEAETSGKRTKALENLMADVRPDVKRLRLSKTMDGNNV